MDNPAASVLPLAVTIQLVMHQCNMVISGSSEARNNIDGFMRHGRPNDNDLTSNYIALQGRQLCEVGFREATVPSKKKVEIKKYCAEI